MRAALEKVLRVYVTPDQLREIANNLEQKWAKVRLGEDVPYYSLWETGPLEVRFTVDQEEMSRLEYLAQSKQK